MENKQLLYFKQLKIAGLHTISFFGYVLHIAIHAMLAPGMDAALLNETMQMLKEPSSMVMMVVFTILSLLPALFSYIFKSKNGWKVIAIFGLIMAVLNGLHACAHIIQGDILNGLTTFVVQVPPAIIAVVMSFKLLKLFEA